MNRETYVRWLGMSSVYTTDERAILAALPVREQAFLHTLKAFMEGGTIEGDWIGSVGSSGPLTTGASGPAITPDEAQAETPSGVAWSLPSRGITGDLGGPLSESNLYTDPEDIPFGAGVQTPRKRPIYALVWTWRQSRVFKTKRECIEKQRVWKKWYERQGWKVSSHDTGYFARHLSGQSHSISLHEYDRETKERLR